MTTVGDIRRAIDRVAPFDSCESFDNVGVLIGGEDIPVSRCLVTLDVTRATVIEAAQKGCEMILSHHPVIFHAMKQIPFDSVQGMLAANRIAVLSAHTNFDKAPGGLNQSLAELLGLEEFAPLPEDNCAATATLPGKKPMMMEEAVQHVAKALDLQGMRYYDAGKPVHKVVLCCGGGGSFVHEAIRLGADLVISGDFKHDQVIDAMNAGVSCIDAGHFETERHFVPMCCKWLSEELSDVSFIASENVRPGFIFRVFGE